MRKISKNLTILIVGIIAVICFCLVAFLPQKNTYAQSVEFESVEVLNYYNLNDQKTFPESVTVNYDGEKTATDGVIVFPNGYVYAVDDEEITLSQQGEYTLKYFFDYNGKRITAVKTFKVSPALYALSAENGSSITAVSKEMSQVDMLSSTEDAMAKSSNGADSQGLIVRLYEGCEFVYNKPVDLRDCEEDGLSDVITLRPLTYSISRSSADGDFTLGEQICGSTYIRLTDCYDPNIYVELLLDSGEYLKQPGLICYRAGTNSQEAAGIYLPSSTNTSNYIKEVYYDGIRGVARFGDWGPYSGLGYSNRNKTTDGITLRYDLENSKIYVATPKGQLFVNDFNNSDIYGEVSFDGFTTGEVYVSLRCDDYYVAEASRIDVTSIGRDDSANLVGTFAGKVEQAPDYFDTVSPVIKIDATKTDAYGMYSAIGDKFTVPTATVYDANDSGKLSVNVYRNYQSQEKSSVAIVDGAFTVDKDDVYYIEYKSTDLYGNVGVEVLKVYAVSGVEKSLFINANQLTTLLAGQNVNLALPEINTVNDANKLDLKVVITYENGESEIIAAAKGVSGIEALTEEDLNYTPLYSGNYKVEYICSDNANVNTFAYEVNCVPSDVVAFLEKPVISRYLIKGAYYAFNEIKASSFTTGKPVLEDAKAYISFDGKGYNEIANLNKVFIDGDKSATVKFVCDGVEVFSDTAQIIDVRNNTESPFGGYNVKMNKYFVSDDNSFAVDEFNANGVARAEVIYKSLKTSGNNTLHFVNTLAYNSFAIGFKIHENASSFTKLNVVLTDAYNTAKKVVLTYESINGVGYVSVNGGMKSMLSGTFADGSIRNLFFDSNRKQFNFGGITLDPGSEFTGIACYLDLEFVDIYGQAGAEIITVNNQSLSGTYTVDMSSPEIAVTKSYGYYKIGDLVKIYHAEYFDVLSPLDKNTAMVKVTLNGAPVTATDGTLLDGLNNDAFTDYIVECKELGSYKVDFSAKDFAGKLSSDTYIFNVVDSVAPQIKITQGYTEDTVVKVKAGSKFKFNFTVSDDVTAAEDIMSRVLVSSTSNYIVANYTESVISINKKGEFVVVVVCQDQAGNTSIAKFKILAE